MFESVCALPLSSDLFTQSLHPTESILAVGLAAGHVQCFRLPASCAKEEDDDDEDDDLDNGHSILSTGTNGTTTSIIETEWRTRRHKGSCRYVGFSYDGQGEFPLFIFAYFTTDSNLRLIIQFSIQLAPILFSRLPLQKPAE